MEDKKAKVLVVDNEPEVVETLKNFLSRKGYNSMAAFSGEQALSILEKESLDLVLLDIVMPGLNGTEVAKIIKEKYPHIKIVVLTGYPNEGEGLLKENILDGFFIKPIQLDQIHNKLLELFLQNNVASLFLPNINLELHYRILESLKPYKTASIEDIHAQSLRVSLLEYIELGTFLELNLKIPDQSRLIKAIGKVAEVKEDLCTGFFDTEISLVYINDREK